MSIRSRSPANPEKAARQKRLAEAMHLHAIEGNPATPEDIAMFAMFEREGWSDEQCRAYILAQFADRPDVAAAE